MGIPEVLQQIGVAAVVGGIISTAFSIAVSTFFQGRMHKDLEATKAELRRRESRWAWLDERVVTNLEALYGAMIEVDGHLTRRSTIEDSQLQEWLDDFWETLRRFRHDVATAAIYIDDETLVELRAFDRTAGMIAACEKVRLIDRSEDTRMLMQKEIKRLRDQYEPAKRQVREQIRGVFGATKEQARAANPKT